MIRARPPDGANGGCFGPYLGALGVGLDSLEDPTEFTVTCVVENSIAADFGVSMGDRMKRPAPGWPDKFVNIEVEREGRCLHLISGSQVAECITPPAAPR